MEQLINDIYEIIKDYRQDEGKMSVNRIDRWIKQFPEADREFILTELKSLLSHRYFSKPTIIQGLENIITEVSKILGFATPADFLNVTSFVDHQPEGKRQKDFLALLREISQTKFGLNLSNHNPTNPRYFIYLDDLLCTGDTLFKGLAKVEGEERKGWLYQKIGNQTHLEYLTTTNAKVLILYFVIHKHNYANFQWRFQTHLGQDISSHYTAYAIKWIENDFRNINSKLDYLFPIKENQPQNIIDYSTSFAVQNNLGVYRNPTRPTTESFFSSKENRIRFENIMLQQGMRLYELAGASRNVRMRPLGYGLTSHKNLGFGTLCFIYRNVPFNTPLVFWYSKSGVWFPLFERKYIYYGQATPINHPDLDYGVDEGYGDDISLSNEEHKSWWNKLPDYWKDIFLINLYYKLNHKQNELSEFWIFFESPHPAEPREIIPLINSIKSRLNISYSISDEQLTQILALKDLYCLSDNRIIGNLSPLSQLQDISYLDLSYSYKMNDPIKELDIESLNKLTSIEKLSLWMCGQIDLSNLHLSNLNYLWIEHDAKNIGEFEKKYPNCRIEKDWR